jgi:SPOR domain
MNRYKIIVVILTLVTTVCSVFSQTDMSSIELIELYSKGEISTINSVSSNTSINITLQTKLASAIVNKNGLDAVLTFQEILRDGKASNSEKSLASFHLYGYFKVIDDKAGIARALDGVRSDPDLAKKLFGGAIPEQIPVDNYVIQIGAFGSKTNAERLAAEQRAKGYTVSVDKIKSGNNRLYAVRVGKFSSSSAASDFGRRIYGKENSKFRVVKI